jgi:F-type H+-transporting ATPase subunit gamma
MATVRDIRRRIKSVKSTAKITKAMQMIAAAKMKKAQDQATAGRDYAARMHRMLGNLKEAVGEDATHPLLERRDGGRELVVVISTDRGLCGGLNSNLLRKVRAEVARDAEFVTVGRKLRGPIARAGGRLVADFTVRDPVRFAEARPIARFLTRSFLEDGYDRVRVAFNNFVTTLSQEPWISQLLPIDAAALGRMRRYEEGTALPVAGPPGGMAAADYVFEPDAATVLGALLPLYVNFQIYQMLLEARASEHSARMVAMKSATDNANQIVKDLTLESNKLRQAAITAELLEISTAMKAME